MTVDNLEEQFYQNMKHKINKYLLANLISTLKFNQRFRINLREFFPTFSPADIHHLLVDEFGWNKDHMEDNGWQHDAWYYYSNKNYDFGLVMYYCGFYGDLELFRSDIDDE